MPLLRLEFAGGARVDPWWRRSDWAVVLAVFVITVCRVLLLAAAAAAIACC